MAKSQVPFPAQGSVEYRKISTWAGRCSGTDPEPGSQLCPAAGCPLAGTETSLRTGSAFPGLYTSCLQSPGGAGSDASSAPPTLAPSLGGGPWRAWQAPACLGFLAGGPGPDAQLNHCTFGQRPGSHSFPDSFPAPRPPQGLVQSLFSSESLEQSGVAVGSDVQPRQGGCTALDARVGWPWVLSPQQGQQAVASGPVLACLAPPLHCVNLDAH